MTIATSMLPEFELEMATTRRLLERVPGDKGSWKPHPKSFPLGHLAQLVARIPGWLTSTLTTTKMDLADSPAYSTEATEVLLAEFDRNVAAARAAYGAISDADLQVAWSLVRGEAVLFTGPRIAIIRNHTNHLIHHRGQLSVYLRMVEVPIPSIYGPSADTRM